MSERWCERHESRDPCADCKDEALTQEQEWNQVRHEETEAENLRGAMMHAITLLTSTELVRATAVARDAVGVLSRALSGESDTNHGTSAPEDMVVCEGKPEPHPRTWHCTDPRSAPASGEGKEK